MSCKRVAGFFAILLLSTVAFDPVYVSSFMEGSTLNTFQLMMPSVQSIYQFFYGFKWRISDSSQGQNILFFSPCQKTTNSVIAANVQLYRCILTGAPYYKAIRRKTGKPKITKRIDVSKSYFALAPLIVSDASERDAAKLLMHFISKNPTNALILMVTKGKT